MKGRIIGGCSSLSFNTYRGFNNFSAEGNIQFGYNFSFFFLFSYFLMTTSKKTRRDFVLKLNSMKQTTCRWCYTRVISALIWGGTSIKS